MTPDELCKAYRDELRRLYGDERADKSRADHHRGWYYINEARRWPDGSCGIIGAASAYRKQQVLEMLAVLQGRQPAASDRGGGTEEEVS